MLFRSAYLSGGVAAAGLGYICPRCWVDDVDLIACQRSRGHAHDVVHAADIVVGVEVIRVADEGFRVGSHLVAKIAVEAVVRRQI